MSEVLHPRHGWGPQGKPAALAITFDNFGEAAEIEMGWWGDKPVGAHHTAAFMPRLIETLGDVRGTYFVEASNAALYPDQLKLWQDAGHEIGLHAWRHELWAQCAPERRRELLARSMAAIRGIGVELVGFRPPGGAIPPEAWDEFAEAGLRYCSALGTPGVSRRGDMASVPFVWTDVDAYMIDEIMGFMRLRCGDPEAPRTLDEWRDALGDAVRHTLAAGSQRTVIFHPSLLAQADERLAVVRYLIDTARAADLWIAPAGAIAAFAADEWQHAAEHASPQGDRKQGVHVG